MVFHYARVFSLALIFTQFQKKKEPRMHKIENFLSGFSDEQISSSESMEKSPEKTFEIAIHVQLCS